MPEIHLRQPSFTYSACGPCTKDKERIYGFKERGDSMAYGDFKDLNRRTFADKVLCDKAFNIVKDLKWDSGLINVDLLQWFINF